MSLPTTEPTYRLVADAPTVVVPELDPAQQSVVDHPGGPLLVLAGPGTGKTTTLVEALVERIEGRGADPDSVLALTFSRKAAEQLRDRVTARLARTLSTAMCSTFHSFAYALVRRYAPTELYTGPLRLLSAPEQDVVLRELLTDAPESVRWPSSLRRALGTRGFAREVHAVLARAREKGLDGSGLRALGEVHDLPEYLAAGWFLDQYLDVLDQHGATDYTDLVRRAVIEAEVHREELRRRFRHVFVDEYQDTDPAQVALLRALAGDGGDLTVVGDPHQSIYAFRGADVRGIMDFPSDFRHPDGRPADVVALSTTRRFGPRLLVAGQRVAHRLPLPGSLPAPVRAAFLQPTAAADLPPGRVQVLTFDTERAEAEHLADLLRRAHLEDGVGWEEMAVLVRSGRSSIPGLRRSLAAAGVPVEVAGDELPLVLDPAVGVLLDGLRAVLHMDAEDVDAVDHIDPARAVSLLTGPLGGLDAGELRRLGRMLRQREKRRQSEAGESAPLRPSAWLLRRGLLEPGFLDGLTGPEATRARALHELVARGRDELVRGATAEELLWVLWSGTSWPQRLRRAVESGGAAARRAHRDLDSLVALFEAAARAEEQRDHLGVRSFLATLSAQEIPADTLAEKGTRGAAVRLLTAHRAKGLEWRMVVVAHVQAEGWPDLRRRATLLQADRIGAHGLVEPPGPRRLLHEERRLFYVACTRARERLVVTAVRSAEDEGDQPSRFLDELGLELLHTAGRPRRPLSLAGLVGDLRRTVTDPDQPEALRRAAARRLARLAAEDVRGRPLVPQADPATWWGTRAATRSERALRDPDRPVPVSASLLEAAAQCPARWFWTQEAGGVEHAHQSANLGQIVHALAERVASGEVVAGPGEVERLMEHVDRVWGRLHFRTPWSAERERARIRRALERFLDWHHGNARALVATEQRFRTVVDLADGSLVELHGYADRVELDADGRVVVVDLKTARSAPSGPAVAAHRQLALYQYAVTAGALADSGGRLSESGGAELVQLGLLEEGPAKVQAQPALEAGSEQASRFLDEVGTVAAMLRGEAFPATPGDHCKNCAFLALCPARSAGSVFWQ